MRKEIYVKLDKFIKSVKGFSKEYKRGDFPIKNRVLEERSKGEGIADVADNIFDEYFAWYGYMLMESKNLQNLLDCNNKEEKHLYNRLEWFEDDFLEHEHVLQFEDLIDFVEFALNNLLSELN